MSGIDLIFEGQRFESWTQYSVRTDMRRPAGSFSLEAHISVARGVPPITPGGICELKVTDNTVLWGRVDVVERTREGNSVSLRLSGRDAGGLLVDASANPTWRWRNTSISNIVTQIASYVGMPRTPNVEAPIRVKDLKVEPGESCWSVIERLVRAEGLRAWVAPDGQMQVSQFITAGSAVGQLVSEPSGRRTNVIRGRVRRSSLDVFSHVQALCQWDDYDSVRSFTGEWVDLQAPYFKPKVVVEEARSQAEADGFAEEEGTRAKSSALELQYDVRGHVDAAGVPWTPNTLIDVVDEYEDIDGRFIVVACEHTNSADRGKRSSLSLLVPETFRG